VEGTGNDIPWFGKDIKIHDAHDAPKLQDLTEPGAVEA